MLKRAIFAAVFTVIFGNLCLADELPIKFHPVAGQPYFVTAEESIDSEEFNTLILKIDSSKSGSARIFWTNIYDPKFNQPKSIAFGLKRGIHSYYINIPSQNKGWFSWTKQLLINPETPGISIQVEDTEISTGSIYTNILSGWQEFWGPKGRTVIGSTINVIPSSTIWGIPINIYIFVIMVLFFMFFWIRFFSIRAAADKTFLVVIAAWILLTLNADYNYFNIFKDNYTKYFGKSIEKKRSEAYGRDYYEFLSFAKEKLPQSNATLSVLSSRYAPDLQARIYLIPNVYISPDKSPEYLLVFYPGKDQTYDKGKYRMLAQYKDDQFLVARHKK